METNHSTKLNFTLALTRMVVGFVVLSHGVQKLFGWFGGYGFEGTMGFFTNTIGLPYAFGVLIIIAETFGMLALMAGLFTRFLSIAHGVDHAWRDLHNAWAIWILYELERRFERRRV